MCDDMKYFDGSVTAIPRMPEDLKAKYATAFEVDPKWLIDCASRRQKWIDQAQSLNLYMRDPSGRKMHDMYLYAWKTGCKTTYYLRSQGATHVEKSTSKAGALNAVPNGGGSSAGGSSVRGSTAAPTKGKSTGGAMAIEDKSPITGAVPRNPGTVRIDGKNEAEIETERLPKADARGEKPKACSILDPGCEACQ
jgi:ribonucleoside-diphosphate reductase alpha chain